jgi:hypothetical protein
VEIEAKRGPGPTSRESGGPDLSSGHELGGLTGDEPLRVERSSPISRIVARLTRPTMSGKLVLRFVGFQGPEGQEVSSTTAEEEESRKRFRVRRMVTVIGGGGSFEFSSAPADWLSFAPPGPFMGSAKFLAGAAARVLSEGALSVVFPGGKVARFEPWRCSVKVRWPHDWQKGER